VIKVGFTLALALSLMTIGFSSQQAFAVADPADCMGAQRTILRDTEFFLSDDLGELFKVDSLDASSCSMGLMGKKCTDISLHPTTGVLYCIVAAGDIFTIDISVTPPTNTDIGDLIDPLTTMKITTLNSFDFKPNGQAFVAGTGCRLFELDYTPVTGLGAPLLLTTAVHPGPFPDCIDAAGDLVYDIVAGDKFFMSSTKCELGGMANGCGDDGAGNENNGMYSILLGPGTTAFVADLGKDLVHGADFVGNNDNISWATEDAELFNTDKAGSMIGAVMATGIDVFGGTATPILLGGTGIFIDKTSLLLGAVQLNAGWITPIVFAGLGLVIYKISRKK